MSLFPTYPDIELPEEYAGAHPLALSYIDLSEKIIYKIGEVAEKFFSEFGWQDVNERAFILDSGKLLLVIQFPNADELHFIEVPQEHWRMHCKATV